ncbi:winged helix-turn-helix domain-containing protein [Demequina sp. TTPB684]|uniref:winged helix-turn-helix domain-containing protein n=1 Tax=unclassified Demequina TaxID=2620311 RepID=UPI001CF49C46|nr:MULTISPECIES: winged helix-turn-helix domain-containing protein [unclassified Demequina]MCB2414081.1 winged helix-turn-helix domain-containing protein [Demequina sp. TTPB684]UPU89208.1 winged helix-turn-helix domain-containing protein [Demequina sp. TMPB413]
MFVVTADQRRSTRHGDRVDGLLASLEPWTIAWSDQVTLAPERTVGDEVQAVLDGAEATVDLALTLMRASDWSVGVGVGPVNLPLKSTARASSGAAFVNARRAVERARGRGEPVPLVVAGDNPATEEAATALLQLLASVVRRRSDAGWEVYDLLQPGVTQRDVAARLGISTQAVSQRIASGMLDEERRARPVAVDLLRSADEGDGRS